jgi:hypothetical protein
MKRKVAAREMKEIADTNRPSKTTKSDFTTYSISSSSGTDLKVQFLMAQQSTPCIILQFDADVRPDSTDEDQDRYDILHLPRGLASKAPIPLIYKKPGYLGQQFSGVMENVNVALSTGFTSLAHCMQLEICDQPEFIQLPSWKK